MSTESSGYQGKFEQFEDLGFLAEQLEGEVIDLFDEHLGGGGQLIDEDFELAHPQTMDYAQYLAVVLSGGEANDDAKLSAYRAVHFALLTASQLVPGEATMWFGDYYDDPVDIETMQAKIMEDAQSYIGRKPHLDYLIGYYMPKIDLTGQYGHIADTVAALVFMHVDAHARQQFINAEVATFAAELDRY